MGLLIAGTSSGSGKTTVSMGLMAALCAKGKPVAPFKVGPDYIDPGFHEYVTNAKSHNLDAFMLCENKLKYLYTKYAKDKCAIIEGVMGMYDGVGADSKASSAHVAKIIGAPVVLVIDGKGLSTSAAATIKGFAEFDSKVSIAGVIVNRVSGEGHYKIIKSAVEKYTSIPCLGFLPSDEDIALNSRHLGLIPHAEVDGLNSRIDKLCGLVQSHIDIEEIAKIAYTHLPKKTSMPKDVVMFYEQNKRLFTGKRIGIAMDMAFTFYYEANLDMLRELGAELVPFSPLSHSRLPERLDALYIGGGFPEVFAQQLSENKAFMQDLKGKLQNGLKCYAECGGFMYLARSVTTLEGQRFDMVDLFDADCTMTKRLQRFGYVTVQYDGLKFRAHEFHHSKMSHEDINYQFDVEKHRDGKIVETWKCAAREQNTLAGYPHVHFYSDPRFVRKAFIDEKIFK